MKKKPTPITGSIPAVALHTLTADFQITCHNHGVEGGRVRGHLAAVLARRGHIQPDQHQLALVGGHALQKKRWKKNEIIVCKKKCTMSHNSVLVRNVSRAFQLCVQWWQMNMGNSNYSQVGFGRGAVGGSSSHLGFAHVWDNRGFHAVMNIAMVDLVDSIEWY